MISLNDVLSSLTVLEGKGNIFRTATMTGFFFSNFFLLLSSDLETTSLHDDAEFWFVASDRFSCSSSSLCSALVNTTGGEGCVESFGLGTSSLGFPVNEQQICLLTKLEYWS